MSLADVAIQRTAAAWNTVHADIWRIEGNQLATLVGTNFTGEDQTEPPLVLDTDIGSDAREKTILYVDRPAPGLERGDRISGKGWLWVVVGDKDDNPGNARVKFEIQKLIPGKDN